MLKLLDRISEKLTEWIGTPVSVLIHTFVFIAIFSLQLFGFDINEILLILTTAVSLEAIYLAIFIQISVNKTSKNLQDVGEDIESIEKNVDDIQEDMGEIQEDVEDITEEYQEDDIEEDIMLRNLEDIEKMLTNLKKEISDLKKANNVKRTRSTKTKEGVS